MTKYLTFLTTSSGHVWYTAVSRSYVNGYLKVTDTSSIMVYSTAYLFQYKNVDRKILRYDEYCNSERAWGHPGHR